MATVSDAFSKALLTITGAADTRQYYHKVGREVGALLHSQILYENQGRARGYLPQKVWWEASRRSTNRASRTAEEYRAGYSRQRVHGACCGTIGSYAEGEEENGEVFMAVFSKLPQLVLGEYGTPYILYRSGNRDGHTKKRGLGVNRQRYHERRVSLVRHRR